MVELEDDEYEALCVAISTYQNKLAAYETQVTKLKEIINRYETKFANLCKTNQKSEEITSESSNDIIMKTLEEAKK